jgi:HlyD family secretion protein
VPGEIREKLDLDTPATVEVEQGAPVQARILRINAAADPESRQFEVRVLLPASAAARPGMFARVTLQVARAPRSLAVPRSALRMTPDGPVVVLVGEDRKVHLQPVSLGLATPGYAQVLDGLQEGQEVVTMGASTLEEGQEVRLDGAGKQHP